MPVKIAPQQTDFVERKAHLTRGLAKVSDDVTTLTLEHGRVSLAALEGDEQAAQRQTEIAAQIKAANERRAALTDALAALGREREAWLAKQAEETRLQKRAEAGALVGEVHRAARNADRAAKKMADAFENLHALREKLAQYHDSTGIVRDQLCKSWSYEAALASTGRFVVDWCGVKPVSRQTLVEQTEALFPNNTLSKDNDDA